GIRSASRLRRGPRRTRPEVRTRPGKFSLPMRAARLARVALRPGREFSRPARPALSGRDFCRQTFVGLSKENLYASFALKAISCKKNFRRRADAAARLRLPAGPSREDARTRRRRRARGP